VEWKQYRNAVRTIRERLKNAAGPRETGAPGYSAAMRPASLLLALALCSIVGCRTSNGAPDTLATTTAAPDTRSNYGPGARVLLDAHNAYPERGLWTDRIERAIATGLPVAIEQDLHWYTAGGSQQSVVAHDDDALRGAPTFESYFFARIRPLMETALAEGRREAWPLVTLNLDFKDNNPAHLEAVWQLLGKYEAWLTTASRTRSAGDVAALETGPLLVLTGSDTAQRRRFHDDVAVGAKLRAFGAMRPAPVSGATSRLRMRRAFRMSASQHIGPAADNYARWVNFPWHVVESGGQRAAADWDAADSTRLSSFVRRAHQRGFWIRFYTLDGFAAADDRGYSAGYNFGSRDAARARWRAALDAGVDFIATDQYEEFAATRGARTR